MREKERKEKEERKIGIVGKKERVKDDTTMIKDEVVV